MKVENLIACLRSLPSVTEVQINMNIPGSNLDQISTLLREDRTIIPQLQTLVLEIHHNAQDFSLASLGEMMESRSSGANDGMVKMKSFQLAFSYVVPKPFVEEIWEEFRPLMDAGVEISIDCSSREIGECMPALQPVNAPDRSWPQLYVRYISRLFLKISGFAETSVSSGLIVFQLWECARLLTTSTPNSLPFDSRGGFELRNSALLTFLSPADSSIFSAFTRVVLRYSRFKDNIRVLIERSCSICVDLCLTVSPFNTPLELHLFSLWLSTRWCDSTVLHRMCVFSPACMALLLLMFNYANLTVLL
ncbi:hypothetical protein C8R45DRAFT_268266 [Mycena sanguinolenta]|nr:hypothetical protein C8R45DRAFT_268266 [Mycena sanguinolenta]